MTSPLVPDLEALKPWLDRLEANEGSVVLIALESFQTRNDCRCTIGWFNADEKKALRSALIKCRKKREARAQEARGDLATNGEGKGTADARPRRQHDGNLATP
jgi:hypothetical protein